MVEFKRMSREEAVRLFSVYSVPKLIEELLNVGRQSDVFQKGFQKEFIAQYKQGDKEQQRQIDAAIRLISKKK